MVMQLFGKSRMWGKPDLKNRYDVVIVGAGGSRPFHRLLPQ